MVYKLQQSQIRREIKHQIKAGIPEDELHFFNLMKDEYNKLDWLREDIEFRSRTQMFDIFRSEKNGNIIHMNCVND